jgi:uncharacterized protein YbjT (DUF2867 family)
MPKRKIFLAGGTGFVGSHLYQKLGQNPDNLITVGGSTIKKLEQAPRASGVEFTRFDVLDFNDVLTKLSGVETAYYLIHMLDQKKFLTTETRAAETFGRACKKAGVKKVIYLSGLGDSSQKLSEHLVSRQRTGEIISKYVPCVEFRASIVIGKGSASFAIVRNLIDRLPILILPKWCRTKTQPIAITDMVEYLARALNYQPKTGTSQEVFDVGGPEAMTYEELLKKYAKWKKLKRVFVTTPLIPNYLSKLALSIVSPKESKIGNNMVDSLKHEMVVTNGLAKIFNVSPSPVENSFF